MPFLCGSEASSGYYIPSRRLHRGGDADPKLAPLGVPCTTAHQVTDDLGNDGSDGLHHTIAKGDGR